MKTCHAHLLGLGLCLIATASHAQSASSTRPGDSHEPSIVLSDEMIAAVKAYADSLPPIILDAFAVICIPAVERGADIEVTARELFADEDKSPSTLPGMRWAWAQTKLEYVRPTQPGEIGRYRGLGTTATLHVGTAPDGTCTVGYQILDTQEEGDPQDYAKRTYQWIGTLEDFIETDLTRDGARWVNAQGNRVLVMTSNADDVIFVHYGRL